MSGTILGANGFAVGTGYSGNHAGLNNPAMCNVPDVGPLPTGTYQIGQPRDDREVGVYAMPLTPDPSNEMFGRSDFFIHGDLISAPGQHLASEGCIVLAREIRNIIGESGDTSLVVTT
jgi:hypothetical protein